MNDPDNKESAVFTLMASIRKLTRSTLMHQYVVARRMELNLTDAECLDYLLEHGACTAGDLAGLTRLTTGAITAAIDRLEKKGFVKRERDEQDRRKVMVKINPDRNLGEAKSHYQPLAMAVMSLSNSYNEEELLILNRFIADLQDIYVNQTTRITKQLLTLKRTGQDD